MSDIQYTNLCIVKVFVRVTASLILRSPPQLWVTKAGVEAKVAVMSGLRVGYKFIMVSKSKVGRD